MKFIRKECDKHNMMWAAALAGPCKRVLDEARYNERTPGRRGGKNGPIPEQL